MQFVYLSLGSNLGDRFSNLQRAIDLLNEKVGSIVTISSLYENPPLGFESEDQFYNICVKLKTELSPFEVLEKTQGIEIEIGRDKKSKDGIYSSRKIDLDIILFGNEIIQEEKLKIPHSLYKERRFVLEPLNEIASEVIDPIFEKSVNEIFVNCRDKSALNLVNNAIPLKVTEIY